MMSSEEDTECFGSFEKLLINTSNLKKGLVGSGNITLNSNSNSNSNSSSISNISNNSTGSNCKRNRQRVDAGEPRNSYSSIPNFSSRPSTYMSSASAGGSGLYGTFLNQTQSAHFVGGLFGPNGFGSAKMLNELFGRQMKQAQDATSGLPTSLADSAMLAAAMETATSSDLLSANLNTSLNSSKLLNNNCITNSDGNASDIAIADNTIHSNNNDSISSNSSTAVPTVNRRTSCSDRYDEGGAISPQQQGSCNSQQQKQNDLAHHMLRNILQGKKDLITLDQELRSVMNQHNNSANLNLTSEGGSGGGHDIGSIDNNNCISKSKNNSTGSANNNNNIGSSNRNLGNNCEMRLNATAASGNVKVNSNLNTNNGCNISSSQNTTGVLFNNLGVCGEVTIKSEPNVPTSINTGNRVCIKSLAHTNKNENSSNIAGRSKSSNLNENSDSVVCLTEVVGTSERSEDNEDLTVSDHQGHQQQTNCESILTIENIVTKKEADDILEDELMVLNSRSDIESLGSPGNSEMNDVVLDSAKDELEEELEKDVVATIHKSVGSIKPVVLDMKRARVENIVSSMRSSPSSHHQVNGCKKRKLYQPQQHAMDSYVAAAAGLNFGLNMQSLLLEEEEDDELESPQIQQKRVEKNALKSQLRSMQEQLAEMQQKYVQLCSRMEQESECQEIDDTASDSLEHDDNVGNISPTMSLKELTQMKNTGDSSLSPNLYPLKENKIVNIATSVGNTPHMLTQMMSKMMSSRLHNTMTGQIQHTFAQPHPLLQHISNVPADHSKPHMPHSAVSNAAAMYLGQQFILEQEARIAKEAVEHHERHNQQQQQQPQQEQQQQKQQIQSQLQQPQKSHQQKQEEQRRFEQEQQEAHQRQKEHKLQQQRQHANNLQQHHRQQQTTNNQQSQIGERQMGIHSSSISQPQRSQQQSPHLAPSIHSSIKSEISEKFNMLRSHSSSMVRMSGSDLEGLADVLKSEITTSLSSLVDTIVTRFVHQRRLFNKQSQSVAAAAEQLNKDLLMASQILDRKSPRTKVADQTVLNPMSVTTSSILNSTASNPVGNQSGNSLLLNSTNSHSMSKTSSPNNNNVSNSLLTNQLPNSNGSSSCNILINGPRMNGSNVAFASPAGMGMQIHHAAGMNGPQNQNDNSSTSNTNNIPPTHIRPSPSTAIFQTPKAPQGMNPVAAAALYNSFSGMGGNNGGSHSSAINPFCIPDLRDQNTEQNEALSLVVTPKKKRHKVTDTRITPRTVSRILAQDGAIGSSPSGPNLTLDSNHGQNSNKFLAQTTVNSCNNSNSALANTTPTQSPSPRANQYPPPPPPPIMPVSLPTSVAIPNPSLHESQVFSPYSPFFNPHHGPHGPHGGSHAPSTAGQMHHMKMSSSPPGLGGIMDSRDSPPLPHPPTMLHPALLAAAHHGNSPDYSAHLRAAMDAQDRNSDCNSAEMQFDGIQPTISFLKQQMIKSDSLTPLHSSTLTPMHLRKAKLMFFWVRYPSSAVLKMYFPDIKFNKNNTAQLVKWFSNFREFYYIQMEKYARQAVTEGIKNGDDLHVGGESELYRVLNLHYNRNNHIEVPSNFRFVVEQTLREFFRAIQGGKDTEQSWKKSIYKIISRMDDPVPEYFKSPNFLEQLE